MSDQMYFILNNLLKLWFKDNEDTPRDHNFFKSVSGGYCSFAESILKGFLYGDDNIYYQEDRAIPCIKYLQEMEILEEGTIEELHRKGKIRLMKKTVEIFNNPKVIEAFTNTFKTVNNLINKNYNEFSAQIELSKHIYSN